MGGSLAEFYSLADQQNAGAIASGYFWLGTSTTSDNGYAWASTGQLVSERDFSLALIRQKMIKHVQIPGGDNPADNSVYTCWGPGEPSSNAEDCLQYRAGNGGTCTVGTDDWNDISCGVDMPALCRFCKSMLTGQVLGIVSHGGPII